MNFSQKERTLLEDQKNHEQTCVQKYSNYASLAQDPQLKNIFKQNGQIEQEHYNTLDQLLKGQMPQMQQSGSQQGGAQQQGQGQQQGGSMQMKFQQPQSMQGSLTQPQQGQSQMNQSSSFIPKWQSSSFSTSDKDLCTDMLMTEKYVSGAYNTAIFEFRDPQVRSILNHIQKEEQQHGEAIFKYMESNGMYQMQ